jgi:hypothetical protein
MPRTQQTTVVDPDAGITAFADTSDDEGVEEMFSMLNKLREPFPPNEVERLPRPMWKGAWDDGRKAKCGECGGYHVLENTIHLDYIGHSQVTRRLLEVDPLWTWEPMATDDNGMPRFDGFGGLWIKLTVCGVTRLGYGDATGKAASSTAVKEIIGDAIRNAAMRFGVALDLWSKVDRHEQKNPEQRRRTDDAGRNERAKSTPPRRPNQDALDELLSVCKEHGLKVEEVEERYNRDFGPPELVRANAESVRDYAAILISESGVDGGKDQPGTEMGTDESASTDNLF